MEKRARFSKMNGLGNEIIVADMRGRKDRVTAKAAIALAQNKDTAFDQIMTIYDSARTDADYTIEIWNSDGSLAQSCGNGTRCMVEWLYRDTQKSDYIFDTAGGMVAAKRLNDGLISVDMGAARLSWRDIPTAHEIADTNHVALSCGPLDDAALVSMGNPHAIFFIPEEVKTIALETYGPKLEHDALFPERCNISIGNIIDRQTIRIRTWERGAGLTRACGTAACATAVAAKRRGLSDSKVTVHVPGGALQIEIMANGHVMMTGPTEDEFSGLFDPINGAYQRIEAV